MHVPMNSVKHSW